MFAKLSRAATALCVAALIIAVWVTRDLWLPFVASLRGQPPVEEKHDDHGASNSVVLSDQARKNLDLKTGPIKASDHWLSIAVPGSVIERPGHSHRKVNAQLTGVVRNIHVHQNQLVRPGDPMFDLELTGESLANVQSNLLRTLQDLEVNQAELDRLAPLVREGSVPAKKRLDVEYDRRKFEAQRDTAVQELQVLGMSKRQVDEVMSTRRMIRTFTVRAPEFSPDDKLHVENTRKLPRPAGESEEARSKKQEQPIQENSKAGTAVPVEWTYTVESIDVYPGRQVQIGDELASLAFHSLLYVEGQAFEKEGETISRAMIEGWPVTARFEVGRQKGLVRDGLRILFLDNVVDPATRTFHFILPLTNEVLHDTPGNESEVYRSWRFKPGQRVQLQVPTELLKNRFVLPAEAVVTEGPDAYVFVVDGKSLNRQNVHVEYQGGGVAVLANDGSVYPGDSVALNGAYQLNLALKKASGSGVDPHAGHSH